jgi:hypothetical protein
MPESTSPLVMMELYGIVQVAVLESLEMAHAPLVLVYWLSISPDGGARPSQMSVSEYVYPGIAL